MSNPADDRLSVWLFRLRFGGRHGLIRLNFQFLPCVDVLRSLSRLPLFNAFLRARLIALNFRTFQDHVFPAFYDHILKAMDDNFVASNLYRSRFSHRQAGAARDQGDAVRSVDFNIFPALPLTVLHRAEQQAPG